MITIHGYAIAEDLRLHIQMNNAKNNLNFIESSGKMDQNNTPRIHLNNLKMNLDVSNLSLSTAKTTYEQKKKQWQDFKSNNNALARSTIRRSKSRKIKSEYEQAKAAYKQALDNKKQALFKLTSFISVIKYQKEAIVSHEKFMAMKDDLLSPNNKYRPLFQAERKSLEAEVNRHTNAYNNSIFTVDLKTGNQRDISNISRASAINAKSPKDRIYDRVLSMYGDYKRSETKAKIKEKVDKAKETARDVVKSIKELGSENSTSDPDLAEI